MSRSGRAERFEIYDLLSPLGYGDRSSPDAIFDCEAKTIENQRYCVVSENPFQPPVDVETTSQDKTHGLTRTHATYNVVTDTVTGVNVRWKDNKFQAIFVFISIVVTATLGVILATLNSPWNLPWHGGALIGSFAGLVIGIFGSGIFLMIYRAARHISGKHD